MKKRITAIMSSILSLSGVGLVIYTFIFKPLNEILVEEGIVIFFTLVFCLSTFLYIKWTSFGNFNQSEINKIDRENLMLKKQIEQKELRMKLESII